MLRLSPTGYAEGQLAFRPYTPKPFVFHIVTASRDGNKRPQSSASQLLAGAGPALKNEPACGGENLAIRLYQRLSESCHARSNA